VEITAKPFEKNYPTVTLRKYNFFQVYLRFVVVVVVLLLLPLLFFHHLLILHIFRASKVEQNE